MFEPGLGSRANPVHRSQRRHYRVLVGDVPPRRTPDAAGRQLNPFPLIQLPYHQLVNPWTLGTVLHEVAHNLQNDLGLDPAVPRRIGAVLRHDGVDILMSSSTRRTDAEFADVH